MKHAEAAEQRENGDRDWPPDAECKQQSHRKDQHGKPESKWLQKQCGGDQAGEHRRGAPRALTARQQRLRALPDGAPAPGLNE